MPLWSAADQSDIRWYDATRQSDGSWRALVNIRDHKYSCLLYTSELHERFDGKTNLVFAGNFSPAQGLDCLIKAIGKAHRNGFDDLHLLMVGDGMSRASVSYTHLDVYKRQTRMLA